MTSFLLLDEHDCPQSHEFYTTLSEDPLDDDEVRPARYSL